MYRSIYQVELMLVTKLGEHFVIWFIYSTINQIQLFIFFGGMIKYFTDGFTKRNCW